MILVDSSIWIDFLHARSTPQTEYLKEALYDQRILTADLVIAEVLQGTRTERAFTVALEQLRQLESLTIGGLDIAVQAARHYRHLRTLGITIRNTIESLVAEGVAGSGRNNGMSPGEKALVAEAERSARAPIGTAGGQMAGAISGSQDTIEAAGQADDIIVTGVRDAVYRPGIDMPLMFLSQYRSNPRARVGGNGGRRWRTGGF